MKANCKHCNNEFEQRRSNHAYCKPGCKTMASYKRNGYKYVSGRYQKEQTVDNPSQELALATNSKLEKKLKGLTKEVRQLSKNKETGLVDSMKGTILADTINYGAKKLFAPSLLPATKGDIDKIHRQFEELQLQYNNTQILNTKLLKHLEHLERVQSLI